MRKFPIKPFTIAIENVYTTKQKITSIKRTKQNSSKNFNLKENLSWRAKLLNKSAIDYISILNSTNIIQFFADDQFSKRDGKREGQKNNKNEEIKTGLHGGKKY